MPQPPSPRSRLRRLRRGQRLRDAVADVTLDPSNLICPIFVKAEGEAEPVESMPGVNRLSPRDATAMLYLARSYRRAGDMPEAARVIRRAVALDGEDADVRRELGHLFLDLGRLPAAVAQYERALEYAPEDPLNWAALIRALRMQDDPRAEQLLRDAPEEVRAAVGGG